MAWQVIMIRFTLSSQFYRVIVVGCSTLVARVIGIGGNTELVSVPTRRKPNARKNAADLACPTAKHRLRSAVERDPALDARCSASSGMCAAHAKAHI
jgi:hypothetical protein